jgi:hypothetical protein
MLMHDEHLTLSDEQLEQLAALVAAKVVGMRPAGRPMLTVEDIATTFRVSRAWVYENARRLGGVKLGPGERAPLRFDPELIAAAMRPVGEPLPAPTSLERQRQTRRQRPQRLLPVYDG